ncbi:hypothetical protein Hanom_Chr09g00807631 [Helianthus anomalus]
MCKKVFRYNPPLDLPCRGFWNRIGDEHLLRNLKSRQILLAESRHLFLVKPRPFSRYHRTVYLQIVSFRNMFHNVLYLMLTHHSKKRQLRYPCDKKYHYKVGFYLFNIVIKK